MPIATVSTRPDMSIVRMVTLAAERKEETEKVRATAAAAGTQVQNSAVTGAMEKIATYIPSEVIGIYTAYFGILAPATQAVKWWIFGICMALIPAFLGLGYASAKKKQLPVPGGRASGVLFLMAAGLHCLVFRYAGDTVPGARSRRDPLGGFAVLALSYVIPKIADLLEIAPQSSRPSN